MWNINWTRYDAAGKRVVVVVQRWVKVHHGADGFKMSPTTVIALQCVPRAAVLQYVGY